MRFMGILTICAVTKSVQIDYLPVLKWDAMKILYQNVQNVREWQGKKIRFMSYLLIHRPHTLFFDESYKEEYYRGESLLKEIESMDCLLVIGTQLETNLASGIVAQAIKLGSLIVEVNLQPCISYGNVRHLIGKAEEIVPILCERLQKKIADRVEL